MASISARSEVSRDPERELLAVCAELGTTFVAYSPLGRGFLTGAIRSTDTLAADDYRRNAPRAKDGHVAQNLAIGDAIGELAAARGDQRTARAGVGAVARGSRRPTRRSARGCHPLLPHQRHVPIIVLMRDQTERRKHPTIPLPPISALQVHEIAIRRVAHQVRRPAGGEAHEVSRPELELRVVDPYVPAPRHHVRQTNVVSIATPARAGARARADG